MTPKTQRDVSPATATDARPHPSAAADRADAEVQLASFGFSESSYQDLRGLLNWYDVMESDKTPLKVR